MEITFDPMVSIDSRLVFLISNLKHVMTALTDRILSALLEIFSFPPGNFTNYLNQSIK